MTLVEVLAGLALLAALFGGTVAVKSRCARQARITAERRDAIRAADELLSAWWIDTDTLPRAGGGDVPGHPRLIWKTRPVGNTAAEALGGQVIRLEVTDSSSDAQPLTAVEFVVRAQVKHEAGVHAR